MTPASQELMLNFSVRRAVKKVNLSPHRIHAVHELKQSDKAKRLTVLQVFRAFVEDLHVFRMSLHPGVLYAPQAADGNIYKGIIFTQFTSILPADKRER